MSAQPSLRGNPRPELTIAFTRASGCPGIAPRTQAASNPAGKAWPVPHRPINREQSITHPDRHFIHADAASPTDLDIGKIVPAAEQEHRAREMRQCFESRYQFKLPRLTHDVFALSGMAGHVAHPVQQRAREAANLPGGEWANVLVPFPHQPIPPFAVRGQNRG